MEQGEYASPNSDFSSVKSVNVVVKTGNRYWHWGLASLFGVKDNFFLEQRQQACQNRRILLTLVRVGFLLSQMRSLYELANIF
ncbi:MAG: hypothetical protein AB4290_24365 [Spirulina sp.]